MMIIRPRAYFGWPKSAADEANPERGLVIHYNGRATHIVTHDQCVDYWQRIRIDHTEKNGWVDIGYSFGSCRHGEIFEGRGLNFYQAAQGTSDGNSLYYSVSLMIGRGEVPTTLQILAVQNLRTHLMSRGLGSAVRGHHEFYDTDCPGQVIINMIKRGAFSPSYGPNGKDGTRDH
jgi:hypothetical protein